MAKRKSAAGASDSALALSLFDQWFSAASWQPWRAWLCAVVGLPLSTADADLYRTCTGRSALPTGPCREVWTVAGRRSGKSRLSAFVAVFLAAIRHFTLSPGERGVVLVIAPSRRQGEVVFDYCEAFLQMLPGAVMARRTADEIELQNGISIQIQTASFRTPRGFTILGVVADEIAFWRDDSGGAAVPDTEILRAVRPSLASVQGSLLVAISSPYAQRGELYRHFERHYGKDSDVLIWKAATRTMNSTIPQQLVDQAMDEDPAAASAEWGAEFRSDLESLYAKQALDAVIMRGRFELAPMPGIAYVGFVDPSGGSSDSMTLAIAHKDGKGRPILDLVREVKPPFSPEATCKAFAADLKRYGVVAVYSDSYAAEWPREQFAKAGVTVEPSALTRSELYLELLPMVNSGGCELLDVPRLISQFSTLDRRVGRSGKDSIDHRPGSHDDVANAAAGAMVSAVRSIGLRANFPSEFTSCVRGEAIGYLPDCILWGGMYRPADPICFKECAGWKAVRSARAADQQAGGTQPLHVFIRERFADNAFTSRLKLNRWMADVGL